MTEAPTDLLPASRRAPAHPLASRLLSRGPFAAGIALAGLIGLGYLIVFWKMNPGWPTDSFTYYLAGQRLNTGGQIYDLRPTDYWASTSTPLYGPPLVAVVWRPLAAIPGQWGVVIWLVGVDFMALFAVFLILLELPLVGGTAVLVLSLAIERLIGVGNIDGLVLLGMIGAWRYRDRPGVVGTILGFVIALKLTPAFLALWLVSTRRWRALAYALFTGVVLTAIASMFANDPAIVLRYIEVMRDGLASGFPWARFAVVVGAAAVLLISRRWPTVGFSVAVVAIPIASPVTALHTFALLLAALAPLIGRRPGAVAATVPLLPDRWKPIVALDAEGGS